MTQKKVLGRGLGALIPQREQPPRPGAAAEMPIDQIAVNPYQPRKRFQDGSLAELVRSIRAHGVVQPLIVSRSGDRYQLIAGERRLRAAREAGLTTVPVVVKSLESDSAALELALIENVQREDLNAMEEAEAYHQLNREFGLTQEEIAQKVGKERSTVANSLRLLKLPQKVKTMLAAGELTMGHARALLAVTNAKRLEELAARVVRQGLNVRQTELLTSEREKTKKKPKPKDVFTRDAEEKLTRSLRTRVEISRSRRGGSIRLHFANESDLIRLFEELSSHGRKR